MSSLAITKPQGNVLILVATGMDDSKTMFPIHGDDLRHLIHSALTAATHDPTLWEVIRMHANEFIKATEPK